MMMTRARLRETKNVQAFLKRRDIQLEEVKRVNTSNVAYKE